MDEPKRAPTAAILVIGDEILSGKVEEQNARFLVRKLRALGVAVRRIEVLPDVPADIIQSVRAASTTFDFVITTGGIGPTHDDVTIASIAQAFRVSVVRDSGLAALIREVAEDNFHERDLRMADIPSGAQLLHGSGEHYCRWPVVNIRNVYVLPGVPSILQRKFSLLADIFRAAPFFTHAIYSNQGEGAIAGILDQAAAGFPEIAIGSYPHFDATDHKVLITLDGRDESAVTRAFDQIVAALGPAVVRTE
jgi:molybdenum cofactor synthesis domain-containing protein